MARETKVGLLVGMGVILLIGIILSDHLAVVQHQKPAPLQAYGPQVFDGIQQGNSNDPTVTADGTVRPASDSLPPVNRNVPPLPMPNEPQTPVVTPANPQNTPPGGLPNGVHVVQGPGTNLDVPPATPREPATPQPMAIHVVKAGDTPYALALRYYKNGNEWTRIQEANAGTVGDGSRLKIGDKLVIPKKPAPAALEETGMFEGADAHSPGASDAVATGGRVHEVESGESLAVIAKEHLGDANRWPEILDLNKAQLKRPQDLQVGMKLQLPAKRGTVSDAADTVQPSTATPSRTTQTATPGTPAPALRKTYTVRAGDTLRVIAFRQLGNGNRWEEIYKANRNQLRSEADLKVGQVLVLPASDR